jgi:hypothetical protein
LEEVAMKILKTGAITFLFLLFSLPVFAVEKVYLPHLACEGGWSSFLSIDNTGANPAAITIKLYDGNGGLVYQDNHQVEKEGELVLELNQLATGASTGELLIPDSDFIHPRLSIINMEGGGVAEFRLGGEHGSVLAFLFSDFPTVAAWKGIAFTNFGANPGKVTLYAFGGGQLLAASDPLDISPYEKIVGVPSQWFPGVDPGQVKKIIAVSEGLDGLCGVTIAGSPTNARLLFTTAVLLKNFSLPGIVAPVTVAGTWEGTWESRYGDWGTMVVRLTQEGNRVSGSADIYETVCGNVKNVKVTGNVSGDDISITMSYWCNGTLATLTASGKYSDKSIHGFYRIDTSSTNNYDSGELKLTKQ